MVNYIMALLWLLKKKITITFFSCALYENNLVLGMKQGGLID